MIETEGDIVRATKKLHFGYRASMVLPWPAPNFFLEFSLARKKNGSSPDLSDQISLVKMKSQLILDIRCDRILA